MEFKDRLKELRVSKKITQDEFALALNIGRSVVGMYETGRRKPSFEVLEKIADFYNVSMDYLLCKTDSIDSTPSYYADPEAAEVAERLRTQPGMRMLFDASKNAKPEDLQYAADLLKRLKGDD